MGSIAPWRAGSSSLCGADPSWLSDAKCKHSVWSQQLEERRRRNADGLKISYLDLEVSSGWEVAAGFASLCVTHKFMYRYSSTLG